MSSLFVLAPDQDVAGHLAVAIHRYLDAASKQDVEVPPQLAELRQAAAESHRSSVTGRRHASPSITVLGSAEHGTNEREYLSRNDIQRLTGVSLSTVDRWIKSERLPSTQRGRIRRVTRTDLERFLGAAA